ncbi:MAG: hypothetical protein ACRDNF_00115 [Streptosporangiaceae bacterium]
MARGLLSTILGDATTTRPPLIPYNPALRQRNRGRETGRRISRSPQRAWASPLEVLLVAERAALLSGSDEDFVFLIALAYTGLRWAEAIGLEQDDLLLSLINVEWQLHEINDTFHRPPTPPSGPVSPPRPGRPPSPESRSPRRTARASGSSPTTRRCRARSSSGPASPRTGSATATKPSSEDGIPEIVQALRLGHTVPGMRGVYTHVSDTMRAELKQALQAPWEASLADRAAIGAHSPVPLLDGLLAPYRAAREKMISQIPPNSAQEVTQRLG